MVNLVSLEDVRSSLKRAGVTQQQLAVELSAELGVNESLVAQVLAGRLKCRRGDAYRIGVRLGLVQETPSAIATIDGMRSGRGAA